MRINPWLDLWDRGIHEVLVGDVLAEGRAREGCIARSDEEEEDSLVRSFHSTFLLGNMCQAVRRDTDREGGA